MGLLTPAATITILLKRNVKHTSAPIYSNLNQAPCNGTNRKKRKKRKALDKRSVHSSYPYTNAPNHVPLFIKLSYQSIRL